MEEEDEQARHDEPAEGDEDDRPGAEPVVILGYDLWQSRFAGDPSVIGRVLRVNGRAATVIGVMPEGMKFPDNSELWIPSIPGPDLLARDVRPFSVFARIRPGVTRQAAASELETIAQQVLADNPDQKRNVSGALTETLVERFLNGQAPRMFIVIMVVIMVTGWRRDKPTI